MNIFLFTSPLDALYESLLQFAKWLLTLISRAHKLRVLIKTTVITDFYAISPKLTMIFYVLCISIFPYLTFDQGHHLNNLDSTRVLDATY